MVEVVSVSPDSALLEKLKLDIQNHDDRQLLAEAAEWYNATGKDTFVTSDKKDPQSDGGSAASDESRSSSEELPDSLAELGRTGGTLQEDVNHHIDRTYDTIGHLWIKELDDFVRSYYSN